jgi:hypothetical protein
MEDNNFLNYLTKQITKEDLDLWLKMNNIIPEKMELYYDFCASLQLKITSTYLGDTKDYETKIEMTKEDKDKHFEWCWNKTIEDFEKENIIVEKTGSHFDYFKEFYNDLFYSQENEKLKNSIDTFFRDIFDIQKTFTQSDLDIVLTIYKSLDKNLMLNVY